MKALFHIDEDERWPRVLLNVKNFIKDTGPGGAVIEVVANGAGVLAYAGGGTEILAQMAELARAGVFFAACRNALNMNNIAENRLPGFVTVVPAGITEIVKKQGEGYAYIKP
ncbi:DsrE family protein [Desulfotomaculum copahuensis]|uniref:Uncharacterized protein n=1 Tax=Desulfotomaculum copahuensis TaxID=1838280 RepID=A0A1B7LHB4_9FIRM|nr:DsrE family protein [Desulfotomaculum copahuensis]OAT85508.1 hypothetical protein A6M21_06230 [Desulfotomaculum copahuensis]